MYVIDELKLNRFQDVAIPKCSELFSRIGRTGIPSDKAFTGDIVADFGQRKTDQLAQSMSDYEQYAREEAAKAVKKDE